ncbi:signal peptidase II [Natranaerovirga pectinivora]|uniref:Lipoprotein signal peptidase n=1 Tax=Natranaerovirga pectinivora TaxID=682400 RepID=A0A4R3MRX2_9FIRM|nr:signal peptidase II [Natranaerovirga pectinivora]TCT16168.1 signal peptidase II [Natranaerovirga pectinivora]
MIYIFLIALLFVLDQVIKVKMDKTRALHKDEYILNGNIILTKCYNKGAFLGIFKEKPQYLFIANIIAIGSMMIYLLKLIIFKGNAVTKFALALIMGGALSNFYDRLKRNHVIDYFSFKSLKKVVFNLGDMFIFIGCIILLLFGRNK